MEGWRVKRQWVVISLVIVAGVAGGLMALAGGFATVWNCSSGDGGSPFVSPQSPQADVCSATGDGLLLVVLALAAAAGIAVAAYRVGRAWLSGARPAIAFLALVLATVLAPFAVVWLGNQPSDECTGEDAAAYDEWVESGSRGDPPADCETY
jgi:hypothetical protein